MRGDVGIAPYEKAWSEYHKKKTADGGLFGKTQYQPSGFSTAASGALRRTESMPLRQEALAL